MKPLDRVRLPEDLKPAEIRDGTGTVNMVRGDRARVLWDINARDAMHTNHDMDSLILVPVSCSYEQVHWVPSGKRWGIDGAIIVCDVHGGPANTAVYEVDFGQEGSVKAWCQKVVKP